MTRGKQPCLIEDYIIPSLKTKQFGKLLEWEDEENGIFRVRWSHKSGSAWEESYFTVFTTWDILKGRTEKDEHYYTNSKGRFRSALHRLKSKITLLKKGKYRRYQLKKYKVNNENTTLKLKKRKNRFSDIKMHSNQEVSNGLNIQINDKHNDYNSSLFSEFEYKLLYLQENEQSQLSPSGSSDSSSVFNSENENDNEYQTLFDSESSKEESLNLSDSSYSGVYYNSNYSNNDLFELHGDIVFSEEENTECKENELTELQAMDFEVLSTYEISSDLVQFINGTEH